MSVPSNAAVDGRRAAFEKVVIVTRKTELEELVARFNTAPQARFYLEQAGQDFAPIAARHEHYQAVFAAVRAAVPRGLRQQAIDRAFLPQFRFDAADLVVTVGPDGLVVNTAKYLDAQPILAVNPDPHRIDGVLLPFTLPQFDRALERALRRELPVRAVTMAAARLNDGQHLLGFNDLFIGTRSHVSARYAIAQHDREETQSSSGIIVSTGAGSTGWLQSIYAGAAGVIASLGGHVVPPPAGGRLPWDTDHLVYAVREPFPGKASATSLIFGTINRDSPLKLTSHMAENGVIFSDGMEMDYLAFNAGTTATIGLADQQACLVVPA